MKYNSSDLNISQKKFDPRVTCLGEVMSDYQEMSRFIKTRTRLQKNQSIAVNYNQTCNYLCAVFPEATPPSLLQKVRGLHVITDFRPPKEKYANEHGTPSPEIPRRSNFLQKNPAN